MSLQIDSLKKLLIHELKDIYSAETQIQEALPKMIDAADDSDLQAVLKDHLSQTKEQTKRIEQIFTKMDYEPGGHKCRGVEGLLMEGNEILKEVDKPEVRDAGMIAAAQRIEHYEMAAYGTARTYAEKLGLYEIADLLQESLNEEAAQDQKLSRLAERKINFMAMQQ